MAELFLAGLGILLILLSWHFSVVPALRGRATDELEEILDQVRSFQAASVSRRRDSALRAVEKLVASHIGSIGHLSIFGHAVVDAWMKNERAASERFRRDFEEKFQSDDEEVRIFVADVRSRSVEVVMDLMAKELFLAWVLALIVFPFLAFAKGIRTVHGLVPRVAFKLAGKSRTLIEEEAMQFRLS